MWLEEASYRDVIKQAWISAPSFHSDKTIRSRLAFCNKELLSWEKEHFDNVKEAMGSLRIE